MNISFNLIAHKLTKSGKKMAMFGWTVTKFYAFFYVAKNYVIPMDLVICRGDSMDPSIQHNDILLTEKVSYRRKNLRQNDIVIATSPYNSKINVCKRIAQIGGDTANDYVDTNVRIPYGYVYLKGDNKQVSKDSSQYGAIPYGLLQSRVCMRIWPINNFKIFSKN